MKKTFPFLVLILTILSACQKETLNSTKPSVDNVRAVASQSPILMVDTIKRYDPNFGSVFLTYYYQTSFNYNGRLLNSSTSEVMKQRSGEGLPSITNYFYYDDNQHLTSTSINLSKYGPSEPEDITSAAVTYSGNHIASIEFIRHDGVTDKKFLLTYVNDRLTEIFEPNTVKITYEYDANGNNTKETNQRYINGAIYGAAVVTNKTTFDDKPGIQNQIPLWDYFKCFDIEMNKPDVGINFPILQKSFTNRPGTHNPLTLNIDGTSSTFTYKYLENGYAFQNCDLEYIWRYSYTTLQ